ncbi:hypothetical protein C2845_PM11G10470 [Panicum miliaceum]|uniref:Uncharacterized protein n=1 Tax=Panicum miliaceum TaxID=4540 RepID=A0A3L6RTY8_PANMI|nr:hypothetical protein C2845_PM11G10470 [Panicum miliaceum]
MARPLGCGGPGAVSCPGYPSSKAGGSGGGTEAHHPSTASGSGGRKMKPSGQLNFTRAPQQGGGAGGHLSQISEDGAFPADLVGGDRDGGDSSGGGATRSFSGGFSIVGPWEESRDIIATLGAYDSQLCKPGFAHPACTPAA